jgi:hypothetical protein
MTLQPLGRAISALFLLQCPRHMNASQHGANISAIGQLPVSMLGFYLYPFLRTPLRHFLGEAPVLLLADYDGKTSRLVPDNLTARALNPI